MTDRYFDEIHYDIPSYGINDKLIIVTNIVYDSSKFIYKNRSHIASLTDQLIKYHTYYKFFTILL